MKLTFEPNKHRINCFDITCPVECWAAGTPVGALILDDDGGSWWYEGNGSCLCADELQQIARKLNSLNKKLKNE